MYIEFIRPILEEAAEVARKNFGKVSGSSKGEDNNQVLTETDIEIGKLIVQKIKDAYPKHNIIDEEAGVIDNGSDFTWVVDPIDGTSNFASGIVTYGVMIGLLEGGTPVAGGVALPELRQIYLAERGQGATCNAKQVKVSDEKSLLSSLVAYGIDGHQEDPSITAAEAKLLGDIVLGIRNLRTSNSAFDAMMVAAGKYGGSLNQTSKIWDNIALHIIIEEAGGLYTDFFGKPLDYTDPLAKVDQNYTWCAASPELHRQLQDIIRRQ